MASNQTSNYKLNQWAAEDRIIREEFNEDNLKVDNALASLSTEVGKKAAQTALNSLSSALNSTISTGLAKKYGTDNAYIKSGSYTGTGATTITITTGFKPSLVMIFCTSDEVESLDYTYLIGDASAQIMGTKGASRYIESEALSFSNAGFTTSSVSSYQTMNEEGWPYHYIAFR